MDAASLFRELREGDARSVPTGLFALTLGGVVVVLVMFLLSPAMDGLAGLPDHDLRVPVVQPQAQRAPQLTPMQRVALRRSAVRFAAKEVGVRESGGGGNRGRRITTYRRAVTGAGEAASVPEPWCADFLSWIWRRAGAPIGFGARGSDYVPDLVAWARLTRRWHAARAGYRPRPGDLVVFRAGGSRFGHTGLVAKMHHGRIYTIEGNWSDRVARRTLKAWDSQVTGYIAPV